MRDAHRTRHYVSPPTLVAVRPLFRYSEGRDAYVLRLAGSRLGPVLKPDRRRRRGEDTNGYHGPDRRAGAGR